MRNTKLLSYRINIGFITLLFSLFLTDSGQAQSDLFPLQQDYIEGIRQKYGDLDSNKHLSLLPFDIRGYDDSDQLLLVDSSLYYSAYRAKLLRDHFFHVDEEDFQLTINPLFDLKYQLELSDTSTYSDTTRLYRNTRGIKVDGKIGRRFYFHTSFSENQAFLPKWQKDWVDANGVIPGSGRHKAFKETGFDFASSTGWLSYYPVENLNVFFGHSKLFSGHGYRSHLMSHQSFNFPHLKLTAELASGKLQVMWAAASLQTLFRQPLGDVPEALFKKKAGTFSSISYLVSKRLQFSVFESNVWRRFDDDLGSQPLAGKAYIPIPLLNFALGEDSAQHKTRIGFNILFKINNRIQIYSQFQEQTNGIQVGGRFNDFGVKGLRLNLEYNRADASENLDDLINFTHLNESLGHPKRIEFDEIICRVMYRHNRLNGSVTFVQVSTSNRRRTGSAVLGFLVNPKTNTNLNLGYTRRAETGEFGYNSNLLFFGIRSAVFDSLFDF